jgi:hypothetical protein
MMWLFARSVRLEGGAAELRDDPQMWACPLFPAAGA